MDTFAIPISQEPTEINVDDPNTILSVAPADEPNDQGDDSNTISFATLPENPLLTINDFNEHDCINEATTGESPHPTFYGDNDTDFGASIFGRNNAVCRTRGLLNPQRQNTESKPAPTHKMAPNIPSGENASHDSNRRCSSHEKLASCTGPEMPVQKGFPSLLRVMNCVEGDHYTH